MSRAQPHLRVVCHEAFCRECMAVVSPAPRRLKGECDDDLVAHNLIQHAKPGSPDSERSTD